MKVKLFSLLVLCLLGLFVLLGYLALPKVKAFASAYIYGYPLLLMQQTQQVSLTGEAAENKLVHVTQFPDHQFRNVVRPNVDTLYTSAWLNLTDEPQVLSVPNMGDRYYIAPFMDAWTHVFDSVGSRTTGNQAGHYLLVGPNWQQPLPEGIKAIRSPTNSVWMIQRIQTNGPGDIANVVKLQRQFSLASLSQWRNGEKTTALTSYLNRENIGISPALVVDNLSANEFFKALADAMAEQAARPNDSAMLETLASIGVTAGQYSPSVQGWLGQRVADISLRITRNKIQQSLNQQQKLENGWGIRRKGIGRYGTDYKLRMGVAIVGLGALPADDALYPNTNVDSQGQPLNGNNSYKLHFRPGQLPPVNGFWSLTLYDQAGFLVNNPINRYALGDRDSLIVNQDGSLDIWVQHQAPSSTAVNWLPSPAQNFALTLRLYSPKPEVVDGRWQLPLVLKQENAK